MAAGELRSTSGNAVTTSPTANFNSAASTFVIADATGYPDGTNGPFFVKVDSETIKITGRTGTTLNVQTTPVTGRGWENTSAASHTTSSVVNLVFTSTDANDANQHYGNVALDNHTQYLNIARHDLIGRHPITVLPTGSPGNSLPGDTAAAGSASSLAKSDHKHGREADSTTRVGVSLAATAFSSPSGSTHTIAWTSETADTDGFIIANGTNTLITIPTGKGGLYSLTLRGFWSSAFSEERQIVVRVNGSAYASLPLVSGSALSQSWGTSLAAIPLLATNTIEIDTLQFNAGAQSTTAVLDLYRVAA